MANTRISLIFTHQVSFQTFILFTFFFFFLRLVHLSRGGLPLNVVESNVCMHLLTLSLMVMYYAVIQSQITIGTNFKIIIVEVNKFTIHGGLRMNDGVLLLYGVSASPIFSLIFTIFIYFYWNLNRCFFTVSCGAD
ncbi:hypothetical protein AAZV13_06G268700 [Glycine max]